MTARARQDGDGCCIGLIKYGQVAKARYLQLEVLISYSILI